jgi:hypothetical protein
MCSGGCTSKKKRSFCDQVLPDGIPPATYYPYEWDICAHHRVDVVITDPKTGKKFRLWVTVCEDSPHIGVKTDKKISTNHLLAII